MIKIVTFNIEHPISLEISAIGVICRGIVSLHFHVHHDHTRYQAYGGGGCCFRQETKQWNKDMSACIGF